MVLRYLTNRSYQLRTALLIAVVLVGGTLMLPRLSEAVPEGVPCTPEPTDMAVAYGDLIICSIDSGDPDIFRFFGTVGEKVVVQGTWQSGSMRPCVELIAPDNTRLNACANSFSNRIDTTLQQTGTYAILFRDAFSTGSGNYALALERVIPHSPSARPIQYGATINDEINPGGDMDLFFFGGNTGDIIAIQGTWQSGSMRPCVELIAPDNTRLNACANSFSNRIDTTLQQTGTYAILVTDAFSTGSGNYALALQCLAGYCQSSAFPTIATTLTGCTTCSPGNAFSAQASISNPTARWLEIKAGVYLPDRTPVNLLGDKHIELQPGFTFNGPVFSTTIPNGLPQGTYQFCGLLLERELGRSLAESCQTFTIGP